MGASFFTAKAVLFELNGVLADCQNQRYAVYLDLMNELGFKGTEEEFNERLVGPTDKEIVNYLKSNYNLEQELTDLDDFYFLLSKKSYDEEVKPAKGAIDLLEYFKSMNFSIGLVTSATFEVVKDFLINNGMKKYFEKILAGDSVATGKPNPEMYINILSKMNTDETSVFIIEGSKNGITAAYKAGVMKIIGVGPKSDHVHLMKAGAMLAVENLKELQNLPWAYE